MTDELDKKIKSWKDGSLYFYEIEPFIDLLIQTLKLEREWKKVNK